MKKTIRVKYLGYHNGETLQDLIIYPIISQHYNVVETDCPDFIITNVYGTPYEYCKYPQVRIMYSLENYIPDLNLIDYAISPYPVSFFDRICYMPVCIDAYGRCQSLSKKTRDYSQSILADKEYFCNLIASHESEYALRGRMFRLLSQYKRVESPGRFLNNCSNSVKVSLCDDSKVNFQRKCKFTLCFESTRHAGFVTEKISDAFYADTIPIYYGSDTVKDIFNPAAFINCSDFSSLEEVAAFVKELDQDDERYLEMLRQPILRDPSFPEQRMQALENFLCNIFDQDPAEAYRRSLVYTPARHDYYLSIAELPEWFHEKYPDEPR